MTEWILNWIRAKRDKIAESTEFLSRGGKRFGDPFWITYPDPDHSIAEQRFITVGTSSGGQVLIVAHADRNENIRIISARKTTRGEREQYEGKN